MTSPKYTTDPYRCVAPPRGVGVRVPGTGRITPDRDLIMRRWRIDCGKATPEDFRKQRNHEIRQWIYRAVGVLVLLYILYLFTNLSF